MLRRLFLGSLACLCCLSTSVLQAQEKELLIYCGITMVRPITELARQFEQSEKIKVAISQGGSEDLYQAAKRSKQGDIYFPGEPSYRDRHLAEGLLGYYQNVGYNQVAIVVPKGNPKQVKGDVRELLRKDLVVALGNAESGSVGKESKTILDGLGLYPRIVRQAAFLSPDSRSLVNALKQGDADLIMNWRAVGHFPDNAPKIDVIDLPVGIAKPQPLYLILLKSARNPALARRFSRLASGPEGQAIFRKHGFLVGQ